MREQPREWQLRQGATVLAILRYRNADQPWINCSIETTAAYDGVRGLFERELALLNAERMDEWESAYDEIDRLGLILQPRDGETPLHAFVLHVDGTDAWFSPNP